MDIQIIEGLINDDHVEMKRLEKERGQLEDLCEYLGQQRSVDLRLYERLNMVCNALVPRLNSLDMYGTMLLSLKELEPQSRVRVVRHED